MEKLETGVASTVTPSDEVDLKALFIYLWNKKLIISLITFIFAVSSVVIALNLPNIYQAEALLAPAEDDKNSGLASLAGQFGGLANLAGINVGGAGNKEVKLALEVLKSRKFSSQFIEKHDVLKELMATESWDITTNTLSFDPALYDQKTGKWVREVSLPFKPKPSMQEAHEKYLEKVIVEEDQETGMIKLAVLHHSPYVAKQWVDWLIDDINLVMKARDVAEANKSAEFLTQQISKTDVFDIKSVLYKLLEEQAKTIMFANVRDEYIFKTVDPAVVPERKAKPRRGLICIVGTALGMFFSVFFVSLGYLFRN